MFAAGKTKGAVATAANYIEDVFSTYLYTGTGAQLDIVNGIDLATKGGMVWLKPRPTTTYQDNMVYDTARGVNNWMMTNTTGQAFTVGTNLQAFNTNGFQLGSSVRQNASGVSNVAWTFRKQPKFFDVQTATVGASNTLTFSHALGSTPGFIIVKTTANAGGWVCYHTSLGNNKILQLQSTSAAVTVTGAWTVSSTSVTLAGAIGTGEAVVAYLYAHDAGGFGLTGTDNVISCGSYTGNGASGGQLINLGYEAQWVMIKQTNAANNWWMMDTMRGWFVNGDFGSEPALYADLSNAESNQVMGQPSAQGFTPIQDNVNQSGQSYIYIAIRRGPMKVPTDATKVFNPVLGLTTAPAFVSSNFNSGIDSAINFYKPGYTGYARWSSRLTGTGVIPTSSTAAESAVTYNTFDYMNGFYNLTGLGTDFGAWMFKRAPGFHDVVCYTGNGTAGTAINHNLGVAPELMIVKKRSAAADWEVYQAALGATNIIELNLTGATSVSSTRWNNTAPTASVFTVGTHTTVNASGATYVAYLFATCAGVSKVGSYTGNGSTQTINCGFTGGARFVLIKRTDSTGDWYVYDTARGMTTLTDPYLLLNSTAAESVTLGSVTTATTGFAVNASILAAINTNGASYIFLAIA